MPKSGVQKLFFIGRHKGVKKKLSCFCSVLQLKLQKVRREERKDEWQILMHLTISEDALNGSFFPIVIDTAVFIGHKQKRIRQLEEERLIPSACYSAVQLMLIPVCLQSSKGVLYCFCPYSKAFCNQKIWHNRYIFFFP